jgi:aryl-alcohol dehydrogenase-like predicted oxidoreductase
MTQPRYLPMPPKTRALGPDGPQVSTIAWGMWRFEGDDIAAAQALVEAAFAAGITLFDTADIYGFNGRDGFGDAEALLGKVFKAAPHLRGKMVLATKGGIMPPIPYDQSPDYLMAALDASLARIGVERVDLWQVHRPDILTHPQELARTLEDMVASGKAGAIGVSNFTPAHIAALTSFLTVPLASIQPEFSPLHVEPIENGLFDQSMAAGSAVLAWSPLGQGRIAHPTTKRELDVAEALDAVAHAHGVSRSAAAYGWIMAHPAGAIPIVGSQQVARIAEAADAYAIRWTREDWYKVLVAARQEPLP